MKHVRSFRISLFSLILALPLMLGGCEELESMLATDPDNESGSTNVNGTYKLETVNSRPLPFTMQQVGNDVLILESGTWTVSGTTLRTNMKGFSRISGVRKDFNENHTGTITVSGSSATAVLDSGSRVSASIGGGILLTDANGVSMRFKKIQ